MPAKDLATKGDIVRLEKKMEAHQEATKGDIVRLEKKMEAHQEATKGDIVRLEKKVGGDVSRLEKKVGGDIARLEKKMDDQKDEILHEFRLAVEIIRHDLQGANHDAIEQLKDNDKKLDRRVTRLEQSTGLVAA